MRHRAELVVPYAKGAALSLIHDRGVVISEEYLENGTKVECLLDSGLYQKVLRILES